MTKLCLSRTEMVKRVKVAESMLEATLQYESGQAKALSSRYMKISVSRMSSMMVFRYAIQSQLLYMFIHNPFSGLTMKTIHHLFRFNNENLQSVISSITLSTVLVLYTHTFIKLKWFVGLGTHRETPQKRWAFYHLDLVGVTEIRYIVLHFLY